MAATASRIFAITCFWAMSIATACFSSFLRAVETEGAISDLEIAAELQTGQVSRPASTWRSKSALPENQPSKSWALSQTRE